MMGIGHTLFEEMVFSASGSLMNPSMIEYRVPVTTDLPDTLETILVENADGITTVTLNRPEKRNAMSPQLHMDMWDVLNRLEADDATRVLVITGAGQAFCAGQDLKEYFCMRIFQKKLFPFRKNYFLLGQQTGKKISSTPLRWK